MDSITLNDNWNIDINETTVELFCGAVFALSLSYEGDDELQEAIDTLKADVDALMVD